MRRLVSSAFLLLLFGLSAGCAGGCGKTDDRVDIVDLNKVLEIFEKTLNEPDPSPAPAGGAEAGKTPATTVTGGPSAPGNPFGAAKVPGAPNQPGAANPPGSATNPAKPATAPGDLQPIAQGQENNVKTTTFLKKFAEKLNQDIKLESKNVIGVHMLPNGGIEGFVDVNKDGIKSGADEKHLFRIEIDKERNRLVATDEGNPSSVHRRDRQYTYRPSGLFMGYMMGSMLGRQNHYYSSPANAGAKPNFGAMKMSSPSYHSSAVSSARTAARASSASRVRSSGGGSFRGGGK